jgi:aryl-phospho-beta-D-glucosidase BglC (GH1 family)
MKRRILLLIYVGVFLIQGSFAQSGDQNRQIAFEFNHKMGRGINLMAARISADQHHSYDFQLMRENHFNHCRIGGHLWDENRGMVGGAPDFTIVPEQMQDYKNAVDWCLEQGLTAVLDPIHYWRDYSDADLPKLIRLWEQIAEEFADYPLDRVAFEVMNEPEAGINLKHVIDSSLYAIRNAPGNEERIVILSGQGFSTRSALINAFNNNLFPVDDPFIIGTYHYYDPRPFTKQADTGPVYWADGGDNDSEWEDVITAFTEVVDANASWSTRNNTPEIPVYCGEFGVDNGAPDADRKRWLWWIRTVAEDLNISMAHWNMYNDNASTKGIGPWTTFEQENPTERYLHADMVEVLLTFYEAEAADIIGNTLVSSDPVGYSGDGYMDFANSNIDDGFILNSVYSPRTGTYDVTLRYSNIESSEAIIKIRVYNNQDVLVDEISNIQLYATGGGDSWATISIPITFPTDVNTKIKVEAISNFTGLKVDNLCVAGNSFYDNLYPPIAEFPSSDSDVEMIPLKVYPNPVSTTLNFRVDKPVTVNVYAYTGINLYSESVPSGENSIDMSHLLPGMYILELVGEGNQMSTLFMKD